jgi:ABC-2 type transport system ATP-binding protein
MSDVMVSVRELRKVYGETVAVDGISFDVCRGEIFALLGPNGSGKTSTLESLEGLRRPDGGRLRVGGMDPARQQRGLRDLVGVQLQTSGLPAAMTVEEAMQFFCSYHGVRPRMDLVERLGLSDRRSVQYGKLSVGQQRRLALAIAVAHEPKVVFLDEPTAGLDVQSRVDLHALARDLREKGSTVILATHDMAEAETLADRAAILLRGRIAAMGSPRELTAAGDGRTRISVSTEKGRLLSGAPSFPFATAHRQHEGYAVFLSDNPGRSVAAILSWLEEKGDALRDLRVERPSLEERFLEITSMDTTTVTTKGATP